MSYPKYMTVTYQGTQCTSDVRHVMLLKSKRSTEHTDFIGITSVSRNLIWRCWLTILKAVPLLTPTRLAITSRLLCRSEEIFVMTVSLTERGLSDHFSSCIETLPSLKCLCQSNTIRSAIFSCLFRLDMNFQVSVGVISAPTQNLITLCCSVVFSDVTFSGTPFRRYSFFEMASKFQNVTYGVETWHVMYLCVDLALYEILGNYNTFW